MERNAYQVVALLTDFGLSDHYVGTMKGVILSIAPHVRIIDISHDIAPQNVHEAAYVLWSSYRYFPQGTIFVAVVDPGVGSTRNILCVRTEQFLFLAPDNGLLKYILDELRKAEIISVKNSKLFLPKISSTFHGRDIFAPVAAHLAKGGSFETLGEKIKPETQPEPFISFYPSRNKEVRGTIIYIDRFGNIVTNIRVEKSSQEKAKRLHMEVKRQPAVRSTRKIVENLYRTYESGPPASAFMIVGSSGLLEVSVKNRNAAQVLKVKVGNRVIVRSRNA